MSIFFPQLNILQHQCRLQIDTPPCPEKEEEPYWSAWESWADCTSLCGKKGERTSVTLLPKQGFRLKMRA